MSKNEKRVYIWKLASFLASNGKHMSGEELADHLNRNGFETDYGTDYAGKRGIYKLISGVWHWLHDELELKAEAKCVADAFVKPDNSYAYEITAEMPDS